MPDRILTFPRDWPGGCPPAVASPADGEVFRLVRTVPPTGDDFATHRETGHLPKADACLRCGLSVFRDRIDAAHQRRLIPKLGGHIARGTLVPDHGKAMLTRGQQPTHTTWWPYEDVDRAGIFTVIAEEA